jgi:intracellular septation protein
MNQPKPPSPKRMVVEYGPMLLFFIANWLSDKITGGTIKPIFFATGVFMAASLAAVIYAKIVLKEIPVMLWVTTVLVCVFGGLTLWLQDDLFIKIKGTIIPAIFGAVLLASIYLDKPVLQYLLGNAVPMDERGWRILTRNYALFFFFIGGLNEVIWRTQSNDFWVAFDTWGQTVITFAFIATQLPLLIKGQKQFEEAQDAAQAQQSAPDNIPGAEAQKGDKNTL